MKFLLQRAVPLALYLAAVQPIFTQSPAAAAAQFSASSVQNGPEYNLTAAQWREDLRFMAAEMERRHKNLYHTVSREEFAAAVSELDARIPTLQRNEIIVGMMRIAAMVGDGHTRVDPRKDPKFGFRSLPLKLYLFDDGLFIRAATPAHASLVGAEIVEIGGVPVAEAISRTHAISSVDNAMGYKFFAPLYLNMPEILHALKLSPTRQSASLKLRKEDRTWIATVPAAQIDPVWPPDTDISLITPEGWLDARTSTEPPLWLQDPLDYHRLVELPGEQRLYAQLNMVANVERQTLTEFGKAIAERASASNPKAIILDLRLNQGGGGHLINGFVRELIRAEDDDTRLLVLTRRGTFSASQFILDDLDRLSRAVLIGEPASSKPSSFGDAYRTMLPNSGIAVRTSIKWWQDGQNFEPWTYVDIAAPLRFADYAAGRDPALEAALDYDGKPTLPELLLQTGSAAGSLRTLDAFLADPRNRYANLERQMLIAAEQLVMGKRSEEALLVAERAARQFPRSHDAQLVHAFAAERAGRLQIATEAGRRAISIDPDSRQARSILERIEEKRAAGRQ